MIQAAREGLLGGLRHLVKEDPECIQKKDRFGREPWKTPASIQLHIQPLQFVMAASFQNAELPPGS